MSAKEFLSFNNNPKKVIKESITPHKIALVLFIKEFCLIKSKARPGQLLTSENGQFYNVEAVHRRDFCMIALKLIQSPDMDLKEFISLLKSGQYTLMPAHVFSLLRRIKELYDGGVGAIQTVLHNINTTIFSESSVIQPVVNKSSVIGLFLRRIIVFFDQLTFSQVVAVYRSYKSYYERAKLAGLEITQTYEVACQTDQISHESDLSNVDMDISTSVSGGVSGGGDFKFPGLKCQFKDKVEVQRSERDKSSWTRRQAELFIAQQATLLLNNEILALPPPELQDRIRDVLHANPEHAEAHYLSYLNCLRVRELCGAKDSLYHCFDRNTCVAPVTGSVDDKNKCFRYAALNLAILHAQFGHRNEALCALREAVRIAHDASDNICLQHAQAWLYRLTNKSKREREVLMERSISRSSDLNLLYLTSLGLQSLAQCASVSGAKPSLVFDVLMKSDVLNCQNSMIDLLANSYSQKAALWQMYGKMQMSSLASQLLLRLNTTDALPTCGYNGEGMCLSVCSVANSFIEEGQYKLASVLLQHARQRFPHEPISRNWMYTEQLLFFTEALYNGRWQEAEQAVSRMSSVNKWDSLLRKGELLLSKGDSIGAIEVVNVVLDATNDEPEFGSGIGINSSLSGGAGAKMSLLVRALVLSAEAQSVNGPAPANLITVLSKALALAQQHYLDLQAALVACHLAHLQLQLGLPAQALRLLEEWLLVILSHGGAYDRGRALLLLAKCQVAAGTAVATNLQTNSIVSTAISTLDRALKLFRNVEATERVKDVLYLQALLYNELGNVFGRKKCALEFRVLDEQNPTKIATTLLNRF